MPCSDNIAMNLLVYDYQGGFHNVVQCTSKYLFTLLDIQPANH